MLNFLQPDDHIMEKLNFKERNKISFLIFGTVTMVFMMTTFTIIEAVLHNTVVAAVSAVSAVMGFLALYFIRRGKIILGASLAMFGLNIANALVCIFSTGKYADPNIMYRNAFFIATMAILHLMMSVNKRQMANYDFWSTLILFVSYFTSTAKMRAASPVEFYTSVVITAIAYVVICSCLTYLTGFNDDLDDITVCGFLAELELLENVVPSLILDPAKVDDHTLCSCQSNHLALVILYLQSRF